MNNQGLGVPGAVHPGFLFQQLIACCRSPMFSTKGRCEALPIHTEAPQFRNAAAPNCVYPKQPKTRKEVILMEYRRPEIIAVVEATLAIEGMKPGGFVDNNHPTLPPKSTGAYLSDE